MNEIQGHIIDSASTNKIRGYDIIQDGRMKKILLKIALIKSPYLFSPFREPQ